MDLKIAKKNLDILGDKKLNLDVDRHGKIIVVSKVNLFGRLWKALRNCNGSITKKVDAAIRESITTIGNDYLDKKQVSALDSLTRELPIIGKTRPNLNFLLPASWEESLTQVIANPPSKEPQDTLQASTHPLSKEMELVKNRLLQQFKDLENIQSAKVFIKNGDSIVSTVIRSDKKGQPLDKDKLSSSLTELLRKLSGNPKTLTVEVFEKGMNGKFHHSYFSDKNHTQGSASVGCSVGASDIDLDKANDYFNIELSFGLGKKMGPQLDPKGEFLP
jgi:hypothetical protein